MAKIRFFRSAAALTMTVAALMQSAAGAVFPDTEGHWAQSAIEKWSGEYRVLNGYEDGTFHPDDPITRGAFAGILNRFLRYQTASPADTFTDTDGEYWEDAILRLHAAGVYLGTDGAARLTANITRQQAVTMIGRAFQLTQLADAPDFSDADQIESYAAGYVAALAAKGCITDTGEDGRFRPTDPITRAELVNLLGGLIDTLIQTTGDFSVDSAGTLMVNAVDGATLFDMRIDGDLVIAPGVVGGVVLQDVTLTGEIRNLGSAPVDQFATPPAESGGAAEEVPELNWTYLTLPDGKQIPYYENVPVSTFGEGSFYWDEAGRLAYSGGDYTTRFGIDVSAYQNRAIPDKTIDWEAARDDGVDFAFIRIGLRGTSTGGLNPDAFYAQNLDGAAAAGIDTGVYFFSQAITVKEAVEEAEYVLTLLEGRPLACPVVYDWEMHDSSYRVYGISPAMATACAKAFCETIEAAGYRAMIYTSSYVAYNKLDLSVLSDYPIWYPEYKSADSETLYPQLYYQPDYWQYTSKGSVAGLSGNVDCSLQFLPN